MAEQSISEYLVEWRGAMRQKEVYELLGVKLKTLQSWEQGIRKPKEMTEAELRRRMSRWQFKQKKI